eukprot:Pgem_evm1s18764
MFNFTVTYDEEQWLIDRSVEGTKVFINDPAPENFKTFYKVVLIIVALGLAYFTFLLSAILGIFCKRKPQGKGRKMFYFIILNLSLGFALSLYYIIILPLKLDATSCSWASFGALIYLLHSSSSYAILLERSKLVKLGSNKNVERLHKLVTLLVYSAPLIAIISFFFTGGKLYFEGGEYCIETATNAMVYFFIIMNLTLVLLMFILFVYPLYHSFKLMNKNSSHTSDNTNLTGTNNNTIIGSERNLNDAVKKTVNTINNTTGTGNGVSNKKAKKARQKRMRNMAIRNLVCTMVNILSTNACLILVIIAHFLIDKSNPGSGFWALFYPFIGPIDTAVNSTCILLVTINLWCPANWLAYLNSEESKSMNSNSTNQTKTGSSMNAAKSKGIKSNASVDQHGSLLQITTVVTMDGQMHVLSEDPGYHVYDGANECDYNYGDMHQ